MEGLIHGGAYFRNLTVIFNNLLHVLKEAEHDVKNYIWRSRRVLSIVAD